jgi:hypothetical protein
MDSTQHPVIRHRLTVFVQHVPVVIYLSVILRNYLDWCTFVTSEAYKLEIVRILSETINPTLPHLIL